MDYTNYMIILMEEIQNGVAVVNVYNSHHHDPSDPDAGDAMDVQFPDGMFRFEKRMKHYP